MTRTVRKQTSSGRGRLIDLAVAAGLVQARAVRAEGWVRGQRCPFGCDAQARRGACNYSADGRRFRCHRCGEGGGTRAWLAARGETPDKYAQAAPIIPRRRLNQRWPVAAGWAALQQRPGWWRDTVATWAREVRGWPPDVVSALCGRGAVPPIDDVAAGSAGAWPEAARPLIARARRLDRQVMIAQRDAAGVVRTLRCRWHRDGPPGDGGAKTMALPQWAVGPSAEWGLSLFGRVPAVVDAARRGAPILVVEGGPDYLVAASLARLGVVGAALGVASCGALLRLGEVLDAALEGPPARLCLVPHRGDHDAIGERRMAALAARLARHDVRRVFVPVDMDGHGDLADAAAQVRSAGVLAALIESAR